MENQTEHKYKLVTVKVLRNMETYKRSVATIYYEDGVKKIDIDENPTIRFRTTKLDKIEKWRNKNIVVIPEEDTDECECPVDEIYDSIVDLQSEFDPEEAEKNYNYLQQCRQNRVSPANLLLLNHVHGIDIDLTDHYIGRFLRDRNLTESTEDPNVKLNKCYFDIETDNRIVKRFVEGEEASTPVNAISFFDMRTATLVIRLLDNCDDSIEFNPLIEEFKLHVEEHRKRLEDKWNEMQSEIFKSANLPKIRVRIVFYSSEKSLIESHYGEMNTEYHPDYLVAFNHGFDHNFLMNRLTKITSESYMNDTVSSEEIPVQYRNNYYKRDLSAIEVSKRNDQYNFSTEYAVLDAQYDYFKIRESMKKPEEYNLDYMLKTTLGITKTQHDGIEMYDFPYVDYSLFVEYSGQDTLALYWSDFKTNDSDTMIMLGNLSHTRAEKCLVKTTMLRNFIEYFFLDNAHLVLSNNRTKILNKIQNKAESEGRFYDQYPELQPYKKLISKISDLINVEESLSPDLEEESEEEVVMEEEGSQVRKAQKKEKFRGAFVADPNLMCDVGKMILGKLSALIYDLVVDSDLSSLYPNLKIAWNMFVTTIIGKIYPKANVVDNNFSAVLADYIISRNDIEIGKKYFGLPSHEEYVKLFMAWGTNTLSNPKNLTMLTKTNLLAK